MLHDFLFNHQCSDPTFLFAIILVSLHLRNKIIDKLSKTVHSVTFYKLPQTSRMRYLLLLFASGLNVNKNIGHDYANLALCVKYIHCD